MCFEDKNFYVINNCSCKILVCVSCWSKIDIDVLGEFFFVSLSAILKKSLYCIYDVIFIICFVFAFERLNIFWLSILPSVFDLARTFVCSINLSYCMRKPTICICENKGYREADLRLCLPSCVAVHKGL